jgi:hypothetical protein
VIAGPNLANLNVVQRWQISGNAFASEVGMLEEGLIVV